MKHAWLYSDLLQALKGEPLSSGFPTEGFSVSAPAVPHGGGRRKSFAVRKTHFTSDKYEAPSCIHTLSNTFDKSRHKCKESGLKRDWKQNEQTSEVREEEGGRGAEERRERGDREGDYCLLTPCQPYKSYTGKTDAGEREGQDTWIGYR